MDLRRSIREGARMKKVTLTLDEVVVERLNQEAKRRGISKSEALREAIDEYYRKTICKVTAPQPSDQA